MGPLTSIQFIAAAALVDKSQYNELLPSTIRTSYTKGYQSAYLQVDDFAYQGEWETFVDDTDNPSSFWTENLRCEVANSLQVLVLQRVPGVVETFMIISQTVRI